MDSFIKLSINLWFSGNQRHETAQFPLVKLRFLPVFQVSDFGDIVEFSDNFFFNLI